MAGTQLPVPINKRLHDTVRLMHEALDKTMAEQFPEVVHGDMYPDQVDEMVRTIMNYAYFWLMWNYPDPLVVDAIHTQADPVEN